MAQELINQEYEPSKTNQEIDIEKQDNEIATTDSTDTRPHLQPIRSHITAQDMQPISSPNQYVELGDEIYDKFSPHRKMVMTGVLSFCGFLAPISSTAVLAAIPEVAETYGTNGSIINLSNALYLVFMGLSPVFWGPLGQVYGRRIVGYTWKTVSLK
jgi:hypothetical protein